MRLRGQSYVIVQAILTGEVVWKILALFKAFQEGKFPFCVFQLATVPAAAAVPLMLPPLAILHVPESQGKFSLLIGLQLQACPLQSYDGSLNTRECKSWERVSSTLSCLDELQNTPYRYFACEEVAGMSYLAWVSCQCMTMFLVPAPIWVQGIAEGVCIFKIA